jgi:hypothetical protein
MERLNREGLSPVRSRLATGGPQSTEVSMSLKVKSSEHTGAKNHGGHWGSREEAKRGSSKLRRHDSKRLISFVE